MSAQSTKKHTRVRLSGLICALHSDAERSER
jgi:hypothetical protein